MMAYYRDNVSKALLDVFPDIGLDKSKLWIRSMFLFYTLSFPFLLFIFPFG